MSLRSSRSAVNAIRSSVGAAPLKGARNRPVSAITFSDKATRPAKLVDAAQKWPIEALRESTNFGNPRRDSQSGGEVGRDGGGGRGGADHCTPMRFQGSPHSCCHAPPLSSRRFRLSVLHAERRHGTRRFIPIVGDALDGLRVREELRHRVDATLRFPERNEILSILSLIGSQAPSACRVRQPGLASPS